MSKKLVYYGTCVAFCDITKIITFLKPCYFVQMQFLRTEIKLNGWHLPNVRLTDHVSTSENELWEPCALVFSILLAISDFLLNTARQQFYVINFHILTKSDPNRLESFWDVKSPKMTFKVYFTFWSKSHKLRFLES